MDRLRMLFFGLAVITMCCIPFIYSLRLKDVKIPSHALRNTSARLVCEYELEPSETLYSVKWYKDGDEFFKFVPRDEPPARAFELPGVQVEVENCTENSVTLGPLSLVSSGRYRCEVSGEAPLFQTVSDHRDLAVVSLPEDEPKITGGKARYHINDLVRMNCTSIKSKPAAILSWFINGNPAPESALRGPAEEMEEEELVTTRLGLEFRVLPEHFRNGDMKLKCVATIATVYWRSNEESVEGERPQRAPALESRDISAAGDSRADRVQAGGNLMSKANRVLFIVPFVSTIYYTLHRSVR